MTKQEVLNQIKLLSALESWAFSLGNALPDFMLEQLNEQIAVLEREILGEQK